MFTILKEQLSSVIKNIVASILIKIISFALDIYEFFLHNDIMAFNEQSKVPILKI